MENKNKFSNFSSLKNLIPQAAQQHNAQQHYAKYQVFSAWEKAAAAFFEEAKVLTKPVDFEKGRLVVACLSQDLGTLLRQVLQQLVKAINELLGKPLVYSLIIEM